MEALVAKVIVTVLMLIVSLFFGLIPIKIVNKLKVKGTSGYTGKIISLLNCFAGGVFLATTFLHLLPEVRTGVQHLLDENGFKTNFPVTEFMVTLGMFAIMFTEHLIMLVQHHGGDVNFSSSTEGTLEEKTPLCGDSSYDHHHNHNPHSEDSREHNKLNVKQGQKGYGSFYDNNLCSHNVTKHTQCNVYQDDQDQPDASSLDIEEKPIQSMIKSHQEITNTDTTVCNSGTHTDNHNNRSLSKHLHHGPRDVVLVGDQDIVLEEDACVHVIQANHHHHHHINAQQLAGVRSFLLLLGMSLHTVFEGLALGLQPTATAVWSLFAAVIIHKCVIAFSLGIQFAENLQHVHRAIVFLVIFAIMSPVGAVIGTAITESNQEQSSSVELASTILQGISTGVFLYVTFLEVLAHEVGSDHSIIKVLVILAGYGVIVMLRLFLPEPEETQGADMMDGS